MPYITVESGQLSSKQKEELIKQLTEVAAQIMSIPQEFFMITIKELLEQNIGIGGKSIDKVREEYIEKQTHS